MGELGTVQIPLATRNISKSDDGYDDVFESYDNVFESVALRLASVLPEPHLSATCHPRLHRLGISRRRRGPKQLSEVLTWILLVLGGICSGQVFHT